ncbi:RHS repeat-associated core domain-containing protein [Kitasatospora sp. NPDC091335]|uniref:RHS repeat-associated core domain-containing protein n=1 Tax=Kitasatospora sp. NPDC091335 TaxID=3364085 RepID=UPI003807EACB
MGEGWDYRPGYIERSYKGCANAGIANSGDQCWAGQIASLNLGGHSGALVPDKTGTYRLQHDDGTRIERLTGAANEARNGEYWRVTITDGTQYYFGLNHLPGGNHSDPAANSVDYQPVYSPNSGDDCYDAAKGTSSWCQEGWRWNLDYIVDPHQNLTTFAYKQDVNYYSRGGGQNNASGTLTPYVRADQVTEIGYGQRLPDQLAANGSAKPAAKIVFSTEERCSASGKVTCTPAERVVANQLNWPDTPLDQACASSGACTNYSPTYWSPLRLSKIATQVLTGSTYTTVDTWDLKYAFPAPGDETKPSLWLSSITRTGSNGQQPIALPAVTFTPRQISNRVDGLAVAAPMFKRPRIQQITTETGGQINVVYAESECSRTSGHMPASADDNQMACMPVKWHLPGSDSPDPVSDWFNKVLVTDVTEQDSITGTDLIKSTHYAYGGGAAWHRNDSELVDPKTRTWDEFRGYQTVTTTTGSGNATEAPRTQAVSTYLRGMNGDATGSGTRNASVSFTPYPGAATVTHTDDQWLAGTVLGSQTYDRAGGSVVSANSTFTSGDVVTATRSQSGNLPDIVARFGATKVTEKSWGRLADGTWRTTSRVRTSDADPDHGNRPLQVDDQGDGTSAAPETCTTTSYAKSADPMMVMLSSGTLTVAGPCTTKAGTATTIAESRGYFDGKPFGEALATGNQTSSWTVDHYDGSGQPVYTQLTATTYDDYGRPVSVTGPDGAVTTTAYTPATGSLPVKTTVTGPMGATWATNQTVDQGRGQPLVATDENGRALTRKYDALGRIVAVWQPERPTNEAANYVFEYAVNGITAPSTVTSKSIREDKSYNVQTELYDGLGRIRQTQRSTALGDDGRLITDTAYDSHGWPIKSSAAHYDPKSQPNGTVFVSQDSQVPAQTWVTYDGLGRATTSALVSYGHQQWATTTAYPGVDRTDTTPPEGAFPTSVFTSARGKTTQLWQYRTPTPTGVAADADVTSYAYTPSGEVAKRTDSSGNSWSYVYDLRGRKVSSTDPDTGTSLTTYDAASNVASTTDGKGNVLAYSYDVLGRKTGMYAGSVSRANQLAGWTYDTLPGAKGKPVSSTRYVGGADGGKAYTQAVTGYDTAYHPLGTTTTIPSNELELAGTYTTSNKYSPILGSLKRTELPAMGGLPAESVAYLYLNTGLMITSGGNSTLVTDVQYDEEGRPIVTTVGDIGTQVVSTQQYDAATGRLINSYLDRQLGTTTLDRTSYTYTPSGRITSVSDLQNATGTDTQCFTFDHLGRLTNAWTDTGGTVTRPSGSWSDTSGSTTGSGAPTSVPGIGGCNNANGPAVSGNPAKPSVGGPAPYWQSYTYDATGNRTGLTQHDPAGDTTKDVTTVQTFGAPGSFNTRTNAPNTGGGTGGPHALLTSTTTSSAGTKKATYQYDALGNTTAVTDTTGTTTLTWDGEDKLASVTKTGEAEGTSYLYDADGNQLIRRNPGSTTLNLGADELTLDTKSPSRSMSDVRYYSAPGGITITRVTAATGGGRIVYQCADPHGTNGVQIDTGAAQTVSRRPTDPFGNPRGTQPDPSTWAGDKGFVGGTLDPSTGLTNLGAREYQPLTGRFLNPDPLLGDSDPQQWNGYAYSNNDPINMSDPSGLYGSWCTSQECAEQTTKSSASFCATLECAEQTRGTDPGAFPPTTVSNGAGSAGNGGSNGGGGGGSGGGGGGGGNGRGTKKCGSWTSLSGIGCHASNGAKRAQNFTTDHPVVREIVVATVTTIAGVVCYGGGAVGGLATGGASAVAAGAVCGGAVAALGAGLNNILDGNADHSTKALLTEEATAAANGAAFGALAARLGAGACNSFPAGTQVLLADGTTKAIDRLAVGDLVTATAPTTGETIPRPIVATITTPDDQEFTDLTIEAKPGDRAPPAVPFAPAQTLTTTWHHPFWDVSTDRWTDASQLTPGDQLRQPDGSTITLTAVRNYHQADEVTYNLTIDQLHTYYVLAGSSPILVHNCDLSAEQTRMYPTGRPGADTTPQAPLREGDLVTRGGNLREGEYTYVVMPGGSVRAFHESIYDAEVWAGHTSLSGGMPVSMAGTFNVLDGSIVKFGNFSGHYRPDGEGMELVARGALNRNGFDASGAAWDPFKFK